MSDLASVIRDTAVPGEWAPDWEDVLRRAGRPSRSRSRHVAAIGVAVAVALVLTLPGIGVGGRLKDLIAGPGGPGFQLRAELSLPNGAAAGTVTMVTSRLFVEVSPRTGRVVPHPFRRPHVPFEPQKFRWTLDLRDFASAASAGIRGVTTLCAPCPDGAHGVFSARRRQLAEIFGHAVVVVRTNGGTARGTLDVVPPRRR